MGSTCRCFRFAKHVVEFDLTISERISTCHHQVQSGNYRIGCVRILVFITKNMVAEMFKLPKINISKLLPKPMKEKEKEKEAIIYQKFVPLEALVDSKRMEGFHF